MVNHRMVFTRHTGGYKKSLIFFLTNHYYHDTLLTSTTNTGELMKVGDLVKHKHIIELDGKIGLVTAIHKGVTYNRQPFHIIDVLFGKHTYQVRPELLEPLCK